MNLCVHQLHNHMKKIRIEIMPGCDTKSFTFFDSVESLYTWLTDTTVDPNTLYGSFQISLKKKDFLEAEWCGCEFSVVNDKHVCLSYIRIGKFVANRHGMIETFYAWTCNDLLKFEDAIEEDYDVILLHDVFDSHIDFSVVFGDDELEPNDVLGAALSKK